MKRINLNADLGEGFGAYQIGNDSALLDSVTSANIACGFHAGDPVVMQKTTALALEKGVSLGAHPGFPDLQGFGRRPMVMSAKETYAMVVYQIAALEGLARVNNGSITHVKPHGALNNLACEDADLSAVIAKAVKDYNKDLILLAPALSELAKAGQNHGLAVAHEIFADRAYTDQGTLVSRSKAGAVIHDAKECLTRILAMVEAQSIITVTGKKLKTDIHSICVHGDTPQACDSASFIRSGLQAQGYQVVPLTEIALD